MVHFNSSLIDLDPGLRSQRYEKVKTYVPIISQTSMSILMEFDMLLRLVDLMNLLLILCCPVHIQGRKLFSCDFVKNTLMLV